MENPENFDIDNFDDEDDSEELNGALGSVRTNSWPTILVSMNFPNTQNFLEIFHLRISMRF